MMLNPLAGIYGSLIKFGLIVALIGGLYGGYRYKVHEAVKDAVQATELRHNTEVFKQRELLLDKKIKADKILEKDFAKREGEHNEKIRNLNTTVSNLVTGLQSRPTREDASSSSTSAITTESPAGAYPSQLYREDAASFINFARDAEEVRLGLLQCYNDFEAVKKSIELFSEKK